MYHILICDDEQDIVNALKIYLSSPDFRFFEANTGIQALKMIEKEDISSALLESTHSLALKKTWPMSSSAILQ